MTKKNILTLAVTLLAVIGFYFYLYRDSFRKPVIQISHTIRLRPGAHASTPDDAVNGLSFRLGNTYRLTCIKILPIPELETNKYAHPVWELDSDSNSAPTQAFTYGMRIHGMHPSVKDAQPTPLAVNVPYRLIVEAGSQKGQHDFTITDENHLAQ